MLHMSERTPDSCSHGIMVCKVIVLSGLTLWSMMARNTIISTSVWLVVAAAPSKIPSAAACTTSPSVAVQLTEPRPLLRPPSGSLTTTQMSALSQSANQHSALPSPAPGVTGGHLVNDQHEDEAQHQRHAYQVVGGVLLLMAMAVTSGGCGPTGHAGLVMVTLVSHVESLDTLGDDDREGSAQQQIKSEGYIISHTNM